MNRRDYEIVTRAVKSMNGDITQFAVRRVAFHLANAFEKADGCAGFDRAKFLKACGVAP